MLLLIPTALAVPFGGLTVHGSAPLTEDYVVPGAMVGAYGGATFPRMGFEVRATWGSGEGDFAYDLQSTRVNGLHLFRPDERIDPLLLYGVGFRAAAFPSNAEESRAIWAGVIDNPALAGLAEVGGGLIVRVVGPVHARLDTRLWVALAGVNHTERATVGVDAALGLELRPVKPRDRDGDRLLDAEDACPDQPEDFDHLMDHDGCPDDDIDRDGVADAKDACPTRAETVNRHQDADGCPDIVPARPEAVAALPPAVRAFTGTIDGIVFALDSARILPESEPVLDAAAAVLRAFPEVRLGVRGHTDAIAEDAYNLTLSRARAEAVVAWLAAHGVDPARLTAEGLGETEPVDTNETEEGRARNRRVEFVIVGG